MNLQIHSQDAYLDGDELAFYVLFDDLAIEGFYSISPNTTGLFLQDQPASYRLERCPGPATPCWCHSSRCWVISSKACNRCGIVFCPEHTYEYKNGHYCASCRDIVDPS